MFNKAIEQLIDHFKSLPSIGEKSAQRLAFFVVKQGQKKQQEFAKNLEELYDNIHYCPNCQNFSDGGICEICANNKRDQSQICIVEGPFDALAIEKTSAYSGTYHILHGVLSPIEGIKPADLKIAELIERVEKNNIEEIIFALSPTLEGEATANYIKQQLPNVTCTHLAQGLPTGASLEYSDELTLSRALRDRR